MKKLLVLLTVMVAVFGFSAGAFAAWGDPICTNCKGCVLENVPCDLPPEQIGDWCFPFKYNDFDRTTGNVWRGGYCTDISGDNCRVIFNICNCEDPSVFDSGETIGIRMTVLVDGVAGQLGAYWAEDPVEAEMRMFGDGEDACNDLGMLVSFGDVDFFKANLTTPAIPDGTGDCDPIIDPNQAVVMVSLATQGYLITADDVTNHRHEWWIDIPEIKIDRNVLFDGEIIAVKIELLNEDRGGICATCTAVCECIVDVAIVCCEVIPLPEMFGMYFPYVTWVGPWATGIVVTNISNMLPVEFGMNVPAADMEVTLVLHDVNGDAFTLFKDDFTETSWDFNLTALLPDFSGVPAVGPAWLEVQTNFVVDGHLFMNNGTDQSGHTAKAMVYID